MTIKSTNEQIIELNAEQRAQLEKRELRNKAIAIGLSIVTAVVASAVEHRNNKKLRDDFGLKTKEEQTKAKKD